MKKTLFLLPVCLFLVSAVLADVTFSLGGDEKVCTANENVRYWAVDVDDNNNVVGWVASGCCMSGDKEVCCCDPAAECDNYAMPTNNPTSPDADEFCCCSNG